MIGRDPVRAAYLTRVSALCVHYARQLEHVPAPSDPAALGDVIASLRQALPLLRAQRAAMQAVPQPAALRRRLRTLFELEGGAIAELEAALAAAERRDSAGVAAGIDRFTAARDRSHALASAIGIRCNTP